MSPRGAGGTPVTRRRSWRIRSVPARGPSIWFARENERRAGHDRRAGADKRHLDILDLSRAGATGGLKGTLDDVPQAMNAARAQAATKGVQRQRAVELDATVLDEVERLALLAEAIGLEAVKDGRRKSVVD